MVDLACEVVSGRMVLGVLWAAAAIPMGRAWWRGRGTLVPAVVEVPAADRSRFGTGAADRSADRAQIMRLSYADGSVAVAGGLLLDWTPLLAVGAVLLNVGTIYRYLVLALA